MSGIRWRETKQGGFGDSYVDIMGQVSLCSCTALMHACIPTSNVTLVTSDASCKCRQLVYHGVDSACTNICI